MKFSHFKVLICETRELWKKKIIIYKKKKDPNKQENVVIKEKDSFKGSKNSTDSVRSAYERDGLLKFKYIIALQEQVVVLVIVF